MYSSALQMCYLECILVGATLQSLLLISCVDLFSCSRFNPFSTTAPTTHVQEMLNLSIQRDENDEVRSNTSSLARHDSSRQSAVAELKETKTKLRTATLYL